jgi:hypothetical protein
MGKIGLANDHYCDSVFRRVLQREWKPQFLKFKEKGASCEETILQNYFRVVVGVDNEVIYVFEGR